MLRRAAAEFLQRRQREMIDEQYREAYGAAPDGGEELAGWGEEGSCIALRSRYRLPLISDGWRWTLAGACDRVVGVSAAATMLPLLITPPPQNAASHSPSFHTTGRGWASGRLGERAP